MKISLYPERHAVEIACLIGNFAGSFASKENALPKASYKNDGFGMPVAKNCTREDVITMGQK